MVALNSTYDPLLVFISIGVAILSSFVALATIPRIHCGSNTQWDSWWAIAFGMSMGTGIWSMHFIGMMAFHLPIPVYYDITLTIISLLLAIVVCSIAVFPLREEGIITPAKIVYRGSMVGCGVAGMHYVGMAAMRMNASMHYSPAIVLLSIGIAVLAASAALFIANYLRDTAIFSQIKLKVFAAIVMGLAVSSMHYTAMSGMQFIPQESLQDFSGYIDPYFLASAVVVVALLIQGGTLIAALLDEASFAAKASEQLANQRSALDQALFSILAVALEYRPLNDILDQILNTLFDIDWLSFEKKGAIFVADSSTRTLEMVTHKNLAPSVLKACNKVDFGTCLCGQAAQSQEVIHKSSVDHDHAIQPEGMSPHGHYCVPIMDKDIVLGVINLYVKHGHETSQLELQFLESVSNAVAGIIKRKHMEEKLERMSYEDALTGLPNRRKFSETISHALSVAKRTKSSLAVMMLDLDRFKPVNDTFGHDVGDILLQQVSDRVLSCLREMDTFARVGGDAFIILLEMIDVPGTVEDIGARILNRLKQPFEINDLQIEIGGSIGVSIYPDNGESSEELIKQADIALYKAKESRGTMHI